MNDESTLARHNPDASSSMLSSAANEATASPSGSIPNMKLIKSVRQSLFAKFRSHWWALVVLCVACAVGQINGLAGVPLISVLPDTSTYLGVAHNILTAFQFFDAWRSPGYPVLLALIFFATGGQHFAAVVIVQIALMVLTTIEIYVLAYGISQSRWQACLVASLCGLNPYFIAWEHTITTETLSYWLLVTQFLIFERYIRRGGGARLGLLSALLVWLVLTRPQFLFLPLILGGALLAWRLRSTMARRDWKETLMIGIVPFLVILTYCVGNLFTTGYFGLSDVANVSLFGKVIEYHMFDESGPSSDQRNNTFRAAVHTAESTWDHNPAAQDSWHVEGNVWTFVDTHPEFEAHGRQIYGTYSTEIIVHHPLEYLSKTVPDLVASAYAAPIYFANLGYVTPRSLWLARVFDLLARLTALLPLLLAWAAWTLWRCPRNASAFLLFALLLALCVTVVFGAITDFAEFWRIRFPMDWIATLSFIIILVRVIQTMAKALAGVRERAVGPGGRLLGGSNQV